jgi:putative CocE/NonD family hydrolase
VEFERIVAAPVPAAASQSLVRMRDGARLATDAYLPGGPDADPGPGPTVLIRTPYDKSGSLTPTPLLAEYFTDRGYRVVIQDVRGKFRSEGAAVLFANEARDGSDTLDWIIQQAWSDGAVAMAGNSYYGFTQWAAVSTNHPALRAISPRLTGTRLGEYPVSSDGRTRDVMMEVVLGYPLTMFATNDSYLWEIDWSRRPPAEQAEEFFAAIGERSVSYDLAVPHPVHLRRFPDRHPFDARPVPVLHTIGWWDNCAPWSWHDHFELSRRPGWSDVMHVLVQSIDHYSFELHGSDRALTASPEQWRARLPRLLGPTVEFFDVHVRGLAPADSIPAVRFQVANAPGLRTASTWPPPGPREVTWHARADGGLAEVAGEEERREWTHDPVDPVPSSTLDPFRYLRTTPDEAALSARDDVLAFVSVPLAGDTDIVGALHATGIFGSTGPRMDVHMRLLDLDERGVGTRIARGQVHVLHTSEPTEVELDLGQAAYRVRAGHRLALQIASSDAPEYLTQSGLDEDPWFATELVANTQQVVLGGPRGLRIVLPLTEASDEQ